jgi:hypothetical protein
LVQLKLRSKDDKKYNIDCVNTKGAFRLIQSISSNDLIRTNTMRYNQIPSSLFIKNRQNFVKKMKRNSIAILTSNDIMPNNADDVMGFAQNNDLF